MYHFNSLGSMQTTLPFCAGYTLSSSVGTVIYLVSVWNVDPSSHWTHGVIDVVNIAITGHNNWAHNVYIAMLNQRQWRWFNVAVTSCAQWVMSGFCVCRSAQRWALRDINVDRLVSTLTRRGRHYRDRLVTMLFLWKPHTGTAGIEPGTHAWLARQSGAPAIAPVPFSVSSTCHYLCDRVLRCCLWSWCLFGLCSATPYLIHHTPCITLYQ